MKKRTIIFVVVGILLGFLFAALKNHREDTIAQLEETEEVILMHQES